MVETFSSMGLVMAFYVAGIVTFCFPHVVDVSALSICIVLRAFVVVIYMCLLYVSLGSSVSPSILGLMFMGSVMLSICSSSCVLYSTRSGVKRVHVVLSGLIMRLFVCVYLCISCRFDWMFAFAMFMSLCCCLPTPMSDVPACHPPASFSVHLASSAVTPAGSVHKSRGDNVVRMWVQLKR